MQILLTGATGFIGRHLLTLLAHRGDEVIAFGRETPSVTHESCVHWINGDLATGRGLEAVPWHSIDAVIHLAAAGVKASSRDWPQALAVNVIGTQRLLTAIKGSEKVPALFVARTFYEEFVGKHPVLLENPYIATKLASTELVRLFAANYAAPVILGTFFQVYGPGDDEGNVLSYAAREFREGRVASFGSGYGLRDWIYVTDAAAAVLAALDSPLIKDRVTEVDIGSGSLISIREAIEALATLAGTDSKAIFDSSKDRGDSGLSAKASRPPAAWQPKVDLNKGLKALLAGKP